MTYPQQIIGITSRIAVEQGISLAQVLKPTSKQERGKRIDVLKKVLEASPMLTHDWLCGILALKHSGLKIRNRNYCP